MKISVVLPTYNRAHVLERALRSVFDQTRGADEVIVVDDASTDDTAAVVAGFPSARLIRQPRNGGASRARNAGVREAAGDCIAFMDSDDAWDPGKLATQAEHLERHPDLALVCTGMLVHERGGAVSRHTFAALEPRAGWTFAELQTYPFSTPTWLIRRADFLALGGFDESLENCEDLDFLARCVQQRRVHVLPGLLTIKYNQADGLNADVGRTLRSYQKLFDRHGALWDRSPRGRTLTLERLAHLQLRAGDAAGGAQLWQAVRVQPQRPRLWLLAIAALAGPRAYLRARRLLQRLRA